jgi:hypothetical protein
MPENLQAPMRKRSSAKTCLRAGGAQLNRRAVIARERIPRPQEQRVGLPRNCLHPRRAAERYGAPLEQVRRAAEPDPKLSVTLRDVGHSTRRKRAFEVSEATSRRADVYRL